MRIVVANCAVSYTGRLTAELPLARRLILVKADSTVVVHADAGSKPLNWMPAPCTIDERPDGWTVLNAKGECLEIAIESVELDTHVPLGEEPGLRKVGTEAELQVLLATHPQEIEDGLALIRREFPTDLGPVDLLCEDADGNLVAVEIKRVGEVDGVEQLARYLDRLRADPAFAKVRGVFAATSIRPQARTLAQTYGIRCVEVDFEVLAGLADPKLTLF